MDKMTNLTEQAFTLAQMRAGVTFNPSNDTTVDSVKQKTAELLQIFEDIQNQSEQGEVKRMAAIAITELQTAQMWAVKAITWSKS